MPEYRIDNICIFTNDQNNTVIQDGALVFSSGKIVDLGPAPVIQKRYAQYESIDGEGRLCMPGWINTHMHLYGTYARGLVLQKAPADFPEILNELWWRLDKALDDEAVLYSALVPAVTAIRHGVTAIIDHHASPYAIDGSLDRIEEALLQAGLRAVLCYELSDRDGVDKFAAGLAENERYIKKRDREGGEQFAATIGLHSAFTLSDQSLQKTAALGKALHKGFHLHLAEGKVDNAFAEHGISSTERLHRFGILGDQTLAAHAVHISEQDMELLADTDTMAVHNPQSNMNNAVGRAPLFEMLSKGILIGLGTDGMSASLTPEMRAALLIHKHELADPSVGWNEISTMVLKNNAGIYERMSGLKCGQLQKGYPADLILLDYFPPTPLNASNIWGHVIFGISDAVVDTTIVNGKILMKNKQMIRLDEQRIAARSRELAERVWKKF